MHLRRYTVNLKDLSKPFKLNPPKKLPSPDKELEIIEKQKETLVTYRLMIDALYQRIINFSEFLENLDAHIDLQQNEIDVLDILEHYEQIFCDLIDFEDRHESNHDFNSN